MIARSPRAQEWLARATEKLVSVGWNVADALRTLALGMDGTVVNARAAIVSLTEAFADAGALADMMKNSPRAR